MKNVITAVAGLAIGCGAVAQNASRQPADGPPDLSKPTLYVVGYAHLDTQWRWAYPETIRDFISNTLQRNFALFEKYPGYVFNFSGSRRYAMAKEYYPADYEKLREYIKSGRWFPCGSSVDENDANVPSAESLIRQVLYGNHYFLREFGTASDEFMLPDCFGFPAALPQVLAHCGLKGFSTQKLTWNACVPIPFKVGVWQGPDGTGIVSALDPGAYVGEVKEDLSTSSGWLARINATGEKSGLFVDYHYYGTGDQGGSPKPDSVAMVEKSTRGSGPIRVLHARADDMFKAITPEMAAKLPVYKGELELTQHSAGSVTSQAYMKRWNRKNELLADAAERAAVAAMWIGAREYPSKRLEDAWYLVLGSQMHDILPGTSIPKAYDYSWNDEVLAGNQFAAILNDSAAAVISQMNTQGEGTAVVVYNPTSADREDVVEAEIPFAGDAPTAAIVKGPDGKGVSAQLLRSANGAAHVAFVARVPQVGFATYSVSLNSNAASGPSSLHVSERALENEYYTVKLDDNGDVTSIYDKKAGKEVLESPIRLGLYYENPANWPAWNQDWEDRVKPATSFVGGPVSFKVVENGPARVAVQTTRMAEGSSFTQTISLSSGSGGARVEFDNDILWNSRERSLRAVFPLTVSNPMATYDIQAGAIERPNSHKQQYEYGFHQWFDLSTPEDGKLGFPYGVTVMCDSKYGSDKPDDQTVRLTLLYTPGTRGGYQDQGSQDLGHHRVKFAVYGHAGSWQGAGSALQAARLNQPLIPFGATPHDGALGQSFSLMSTSDPNVAITAIKKAEDSDEVVVRLRELPGSGTKDVKIAMATPLAAAREVDGQEREIGGARLADGRLVTDVHGFGLRAFAVRTGKPPVTSPHSTGVPLKLPFDTDVVSTNADRKEGDFDGKGNSIPAEQFGDRVATNGYTFELGPTRAGQNNAVSCRGQQVSLPEGVDRVFLLAAATEDVDATIAVGETAQPWSVQSWGGYIGQWDHRLWKGQIPDSAYNWSNDISGLEPGYVKQDPVAWFCSHHHSPGGDVLYEYCYLFEYAFDVPPGAKSITLPRDARIKVMAATAAKVGSARAFAAAPLFDTLESATDHSKPTIVVAPGSGDDARLVRVEPGLYWRSGAFRYTLDGSDPTAASAVYAGPVWVTSSATMKVGQVEPGGAVGSIVSTEIDVHDRTPPSVTRVAGVALSPKVMVEFSEPIERCEPSCFAVTPSAQVRTVDLAPDRMSAILTLAAPLDAKENYQIRVSGVRDGSPAHNELKDGSFNLKPGGPVYTLDAVKEMGLVAKDVPGLPVKSRDNWTINMWVKAEKQPSNHTIFAGFGACATGRTGGGRYLSKFANGVHFWSDNQDVETKRPLRLNEWQMLSATYDGAVLRVYQDGKKIGEEQVSLIDDQNIVHVGPKDPWDRRYQFEGQMRDVSIWNAALDETSLAVLNAAAPR